MASRLRAFFAHERDAVRSASHAMEFDPHTQWVFHRKMCWFWIANIIPVTILLVGIFMFSTRIALVLTSVMLGLNTYYSLYANFDTEFDAVSASYAAMQADFAATQLTRKEDS